eukprot:CAMPEP_0114668314 /NCGR_PEP_ID=MMETSP0191-20121206/36007_1 /TAXON_ID=126664 /ORGANISM="Sorites sp." /LENGTH=53 /DNA_ID=CAMNT_0001920979 /DNA_START=50 /DNA_END=211 /DNA_ORIENTATION=-
MNPEVRDDATLLGSAIVGGAAGFAAAGPIGAFAGAVSGILAGACAVTGMQNGH